MAHPFPSKGKYRQLNLFAQKLCSAELVAADSPRGAFYRIWIEDNNGVFMLIKESGIKGRVLDKRSWSFESPAEAQKKRSSGALRKNQSGAQIAVKISVGSTQPDRLKF